MSDGDISTAGEAMSLAGVTAHTPRPEAVAITQIDRDAAADIWRDYCAKVGEIIVERNMRAGGLDFGLPTMLARHRLNTRPATDASVLREAVLAVLDAVRDYLPPDGISAQECLNRVIGSVDNPTINPVIREIENGNA